MSKYQDCLFLQIYDESINTDDFDEEKSKKCLICGSNCFQEYITYLYEIKKSISSCFFCNMLCNFKKEYIGLALVAISKISQIEINKNANDYFKENNEIIPPTKIDKKCKIVNLPIIKYALCDEKIRSNDYFKEFKIIFTQNCHSEIINFSKNMFTNNKKIKINYDTDFFDVDTYKLSQEESKMVDDNFNNDVSDIKCISESMKKKLNDAKNRKKIINLLLS